MFKKYQGKLYCFSPPVMLFTFLFEFGLAFYTIWRYKLTTVTRLAFVILLSLGTFQFTEYMTCGGLGLSHPTMVRIGYASITLLPALGIHMIVTLAKKNLPMLIGTAYASSALFIAFFLFASGAVGAEACYANYAVFYTHDFGGRPFMYYYYGWLLIGAYLAYRWSLQQPKHKKALAGMTFGYAAFIVPTTAFNLIDPTTIHGVPSIMCGFAVLFAIALVLVVLPNSTPKAKRK